MKHKTTITVRSYECDEYRHVNNAVYLNYLEHARMEFILDAGFDYKDFRNQGYGLLVTRVTIDFKLPAVLEDELSIVTFPIKKGAGSGIFRQIIYREEELISSAEVKWVCINEQTGRPVRLPEQFDFSELIPEENP
ncbi:MAG: acyl-CoA thioesterase [Spirochaetales bacterium]|nr:acyl-CoA thioesterase [Spirochaetales bacterium]MCF7939420.1 acyl-CoA thioesterase [Spirochaetales bacterium]